MLVRAIVIPINIISINQLDKDDAVSAESGGSVVDLPFDIIKEYCDAIEVLLSVQVRLCTLVNNSLPVV